LNHKAILKCNLEDMETPAESSDNTDWISTALCDSCKEVPWGSQGWRDFFSNESWRTRLNYVDFGNPYKTIAYDLPSRQFFEQARSCSWCRLLRDELKTPDDPPMWLRAAERRQDKFTDLSFTMRFPLAESISPDKLNMIRITCLAKSDTGFADTHLTLGILARPSQ
jgi:hypothetical protein